MATGPGKGRYTVYVPKKSARRNFLEKIFKGDGSDFVPTVGSIQHAPPFIGMDQTDAIQAAAKFGNEILRATATDGITPSDPGMFPEGVDLKFTGRGSGVDIPDTAAGKDGLWNRPGDPANSFVPDITSPGPGKTGGLDKDVDPKIKSSDIKPNAIIGGPNTGTKSPSTVAGKIYEAQTLGTFLNKGKSGGDV